MSNKTDTKTMSKTDTKTDTKTKSKIECLFCGALDCSECKKEKTCECGEKFIPCTGYVNSCYSCVNAMVPDLKKQFQQPCWVCESVIQCEKCISNSKSECVCYILACERHKKKNICALCEKVYDCCKIECIDKCVCVVCGLCDEHITSNKCDVCDVIDECPMPTCRDVCVCLDYVRCDECEELRIAIVNCDMKHPKISRTHYMMVFYTKEVEVSFEHDGKTITKKIKQKDIRYFPVIKDILSSEFFDSMGFVIDDNVSHSKWFEIYKEIFFEYDFQDPITVQVISRFYL